MSVTVCLLNYRREKNMAEVVESLLRQTIRPRIFCWNNSGQPCGDWAADVDWMVQSSDNRFCLPRWWMAAQSPDEFVATLDDDLALSDQRVLADVLDSQHSYGLPRTIMGNWGVVFTQANYADCDHVDATSVPAPYDYLPVDMVKGRFMVLRTETLRELPLHSPRINEEDIAINGMLADGELNKHMVLRLLDGRFKELPAPAAWSRRPEHNASRELARKRFFPKSF